MPTDFYDLLGVSSDASEGEIRRAYRRKVKEYHPDVNDHPRAHAQFKVLKKAKEVLLDPAERVSYDRLGHREYLAKRLQGELPSTDFPDIDARRRDREPPTADPGASGGPTGSQAAGNRTEGGPDRRTSSSRAGVAGRTARSNRTVSPGAAAGGRLIRNLWVGILAGFLFFVGSLGMLVGGDLGSGDRTGIGDLVGLFVDTPSEALSLVWTDRFGIPIVTDALDPLRTGSVTIESVAFLVSLIALPAMFTGAVYLLRRRTVWKASWMYVIAAGAPLVGVGLNGAGIALLPIDAAVYVLAPVLAVGTFLFHRFR